ncbi:MAG: nucleotide sugar dehydrogenase [Alphaproteobacteria bacterium]|nr:nucleotide sugar dehydrogenase [Alphaproteobacteria bacterium]
MTALVIGFMGLSHLGLNSAVASAEHGFQTIGFDPDHERVGQLRDGKVHISEPGLSELLSKNRDRLTFAADDDAVKGCDVVFVALDVETDDEGRSDLRAVDALIELALARTHENAAIVVLSQVPPGYMRPRSAGDRALYYQVETLIFGRAVERALHPERFIVGAADPDAPLPAAYEAYLERFGCPRLIMRYESAELAKISINCCLAASISAANMLAELCESVGADWSEIAPALKLDQRIGPRAYLTPGLGIAGGNLERDLWVVRRMAEEYGSDAGVVSSWIANSAHRKEWAYRTLQSHLLDNNPHARIAVLGLAYKENTDSTKNAPALALLARLSVEHVTVYDPVVGDIAVPNVIRAQSMMAAVKEADAVVIMTPWDEFRTLEPSSLADAMAGRLVLDPFQILNRQAAIAVGLEYVTLGVSERGLY